MRIWYRQIDEPQAGIPTRIKQTILGLWNACTRVTCRIRSWPSGSVHLKTQH